LTDWLFDATLLVASAVCFLLMAGFLATALMDE